MEAAAVAAPDWHFLGVMAESTSADRLHGVVQGRYVTVIKHNEQLYCLDSVCFHAGGPLALGDIEDVNGVACLRCPWHYYFLALENGEKWYQGTVQGPDGKLLPGPWKSVGQRQRTHHVEQRQDGGIWVKLNLEGELASDEYAHKPECGLRIATGHLRLSPQHLHASDGSLSPRLGSPRRDGRAASPRRNSSPRASPPASPRYSGEGEDIWPQDLPEPPMHSHSRRHNGSLGSNPSSGGSSNPK